MGLQFLKQKLQQSLTLAYHRKGTLIKVNPLLLTIRMTTIAITRAKRQKKKIFYFLLSFFLVPLFLPLLS